MTLKTSPLFQINVQNKAQFGEKNGWQMVTRYTQTAAEANILYNQAALIDQTGRGLVRIEGETAVDFIKNIQLPENSYSYPIRSDLIFVYTPVGQGGEAAQSLTLDAAQSPGFVTVTDVTDGHATLLLSGPQSRDILSCLCGLDLHPSIFPDQTANFSSVAKTRQLIIRQDINNLVAYHLLGGRSFAIYLWNAILEAGKSFGMGICGWQAIEFDF